MAALLATAALVASASAATAAPAQPHVPGSRIAHPAFANPGDASPSLSRSVTPSGQPAAAAVGRGDSLWFYDQVKGSWHGTRLAGPGSADSGPSLFAGAGGTAYLAVEGAGG